MQEYGEGAYIRTWISIAPKMYSYQVVRDTDDGGQETLKMCTKAKGIVLNYTVKLRLTFDIFQDMVASHYRWFHDMTTAYGETVDDDDDVTEIRKPLVQTVHYPTFNILPDRRLETGCTTKEVKCVFDKRRIFIDNADSERAISGSRAVFDRGDNQPPFPVSVGSVPLGYNDGREYPTRIVDTRRFGRLLAKQIQQQASSSSDSELDLDEIEQRLDALPPLSDDEEIQHVSDSSELDLDEVERQLNSLSSSDSD